MRVTSLRLALAAFALSLFGIASIVAANPGTTSGTTFKVANVPGGDTLLPTEKGDKSLERLLSSPVEASSGRGKTVVAHPGYHTVVAAVSLAHAQEFPLELSPDAVWSMVAQGFARHVTLNPEQYRNKFVSHSGKKEIRVIRDEFVKGSPDNDWQGVFGEFSKRIKEYIGDKTHSAIVADFSTTGVVEKAASEVVLMETVQSYFKYVVVTRCGIPSITLTGTTQDWEKVRAKAQALKAIGGMDWWFDEVLPILDRFVDASKGNVDQKFWNDIYNENGGSGVPTINGWIVKLVPYVKDMSKADKPVSKKNPVLEPRGVTTHLQLPSSMSAVPFVWEYLGKNYDYQFMGGASLIEQDAKTKTVRPVMGWAIRPTPTAPVKNDD